MASLSKEEIAAEVEAKGFKLEDSSKYKNLDSEITVQCSKGHNIITNLKSFRHPSFECPFCASAEMHVVSPQIVPDKHGFRIIACDQATEKFGVSIWDDGKLVYYNVFNFIDGIVSKRLEKIDRFLDQVLIDTWKPDYIVFEDIQLEHNNVMTFKVLAQLLGVCEVEASKHNVDYAVVTPSTWRAGVGILGAAKDRATRKTAAINRVLSLTGANVTDDTAEAILIGKYATGLYKSKKAF